VVSVDWPSLLLGGAISLVASLLVSAWFYRLATRDLKREAADLKQAAADLRRLNLLLIHLLDGAGVIDVKEYDPQTGEPKRWRVHTSLKLLWRTEASEGTKPPQAPETASSEADSGQPRPGAPGPQEGYSGPGGVGCSGADRRQ